MLVIKRNRFTFEIKREIHSKREIFKRFSQKSRLNSHFLVHTKEKLFICEVCNKTFSQKSDVNMRIQIHTKEKTFSHEAYNKRFSQKSHLSKKDMSSH